MLIIRIGVCRPFGLYQIAGADSSCAVRRVTFRGFDKSVSNVVAEPSSLYPVSHELSLRAWSLPRDLLLI